MWHLLAANRTNCKLTRFSIPKNRSIANYIRNGFCKCKFTQFLSRRKINYKYIERVYSVSMCVSVVGTTQATPKCSKKHSAKNMNIASRFQIMWELCSSVVCVYLWSFLGFLSMHLCVLIAMVVWACSQKNTNQTTIIAHNITRTFLAQMADLELIKRSRFDLRANRDRKLNALQWSYVIVMVDVFFFLSFCRTV